VRHYQERINEITAVLIMDAKVCALSSETVPHTTPKNEYFSTNLLNQLLFLFCWIIVWIFIFQWTGHDCCVL